MRLSPSGCRSIARLYFRRAWLATRNVLAAVLFIGWILTLCVLLSPFLIKLGISTLSRPGFDVLKHAECIDDVWSVMAKPHSPHISMVV